MTHKVSDLSPEQRVAIEALVGRTLTEDESLVVRPCRIIKAAPQGEEREEAARRYLDHLDMLNRRVSGVPTEEIEAVIEEALEHSRHGPE